MSIHFMVSPDRGRISLFEHVTRVAQASSPAGSGTVPVRGPETGGETPPQPAGEDARATVFSATQLASHRPSHRAKTGMRPRLRSQSIESIATEPPREAATASPGADSRGLCQDSCVWLVPSPWLKCAGLGSGGRE